MDDRNATGRRQQTLVSTDLLAEVDALSARLFRRMKVSRVDTLEGVIRLGLAKAASMKGGDEFLDAVEAHHPQAQSNGKAKEHAHN